MSYRIDDTCVLIRQSRFMEPIINTQTLEHASPVSLAGCKRIMDHTKIRLTMKVCNMMRIPCIFFVMVILLLRK